MEPFLTSCFIRYRPPRIGWLIESGNKDNFRAAIHLSCLVAGGAAWPIFEIEDPQIGEKVARLNPDSLIVMADTKKVPSAILNQLPHLYRAKFVNDNSGPPEEEFDFLQLYHSTGQWLEKRTEITEYTTAPDDPLADLLLVYSGGYGSYGSWSSRAIDSLKEKLWVEERRVQPNEPLPRELKIGFNPRSASMGMLTEESLFNFGRYNFIGDSQNLSDLVEFWNLRTTGRNAFFHDPNYAERLTELIAKPVGLRPFFRDTIVSVSSTTLKLEFPDVESTSKEAFLDCLKTFNVSYFDDSSTATAHAFRDGANYVFRFEISPNKFFRDVEWHAEDCHLLQEVYATFRMSSDFPESSPYTTATPYAPQLNYYYQLHFTNKEVRSMRQGDLSVLCDESDRIITFKCFEKQELIETLFDEQGVKIVISDAGHKWAQMVRKLGGVENTAVFKLRGVRELMKKPPTSSFNTGELKQLVNNNGDLNQFAFAVPDIGGETKNLDQKVIDYLVKKGVLRLGMYLKCAICSIHFWLPADEIGESVKCRICGGTFAIYGQLNAWRFAKSGIFEIPENEAGAISVSLTLQQLMSIEFRTRSVTLGASRCVFSKNDECETDFILLLMGVPKTRVVIGECKTGKAISRADVKNLLRVAQTMETDFITPYIVFAKLREFTEPEIDSILELVGAGFHNIILLHEHMLCSENLGNHRHRLDELVQECQNFLRLEKQRRATGQHPSV